MDKEQKKQRGGEIPDNFRVLPPELKIMISIQTLEEKPIGLKPALKKVTHIVKKT